MFTQWRQAVESLTQGPSVHPPKAPQPASGSANPNPTARSSTEIHLQASDTPSQLVDPTLSNLRKTLSTQRPPSPAQSKGSPPEQPAVRLAGHRTTLEDRLRAKFVIGDASNVTSPSPSSRPSPISTPVSTDPLAPPPISYQSDPPLDAPERNPPRSPKSIPLPVSPPLPPVEGASEPTLDMLFSLEEGPPTAADGLLDPPTNREEAESVLGPTSASSIGRQLQASDPPLPDEASYPEAETPLAGGTRHEDIQRLDGCPGDAPILNAGREEGLSDNSQVAAEVSDLPAALVGMHVDTAPPLAEAAMAQNNSLEMAPSHPSNPRELDIEALQRRLKLVEQRFSDVSTSFKRLQAEKAAADRVLAEFTALESVHDANALSDYLQSVVMKNEMAQDEIRRLTGKLTRQEERIEELRDTHTLESKSQLNQIENLRAQIAETEALLKASQLSYTDAWEVAEKRKTEIESLVTEIEKVKFAGKEEEEKCAKAVALLKTVRQKLVKAEKERDDAHRDLLSLKEKDRDEQEKGAAEKQKLFLDVQKANQEKEVAVTVLRSQWDKEVATLNERHEKEQSALRGQMELEAVTMKSVFSRDIDAKQARVSQMESIVQTLRTEKDELFDQLQLRQAELESSQHHLESLQSQLKELQFQLRETSERTLLLQEELADSQRSYTGALEAPSSAADEVSRLLFDVEMKYEARISDLRRQLAAVERERSEGESEWGRKLNERIKEIDALKVTITQSTRHKEEEEVLTSQFKQEATQLHEELRASQSVISELREQAGRIVNSETLARSQLTEVHAKVSALQQHLEEARSREAQAKTSNKTLREELRKVQSSAALLERQRNPGVGYWATKADGTSRPSSPKSSSSELTPQNGTTSRSGSPAPTRSDEDVNFEYLRNVILQFLEHREMRPHLVKILSTILHFTPQETRRLVSKV